MTLPPTILVIDDDPFVCRLLRRALHDYRVESVTDGEGGLDLLRAGRRFDLVLCDLHLPDMGGSRVIDGIAAVDRAQAERVRFVTGGAIGDEDQRFIDHLVEPVIYKPFTIEELRSAVARILRPVGEAA